jgi:hypothetical protein
LRAGGVHRYLGSQVISLQRQANPPALRQVMVDVKQC